MSCPDHLKGQVARELSTGYLQGSQVQKTEDDISLTQTGLPREVPKGGHHRRQRSSPQDLMRKLGIEAQDVYYNACPSVLYEQALRYEKGSHIVSSGALAVYSGKKTGRSPKDKRVVDEPSSTKDIWWGKVNIKMEESAFLVNRERAVDYLNSQERVYVVDGFAGWDPEYRVPIRVITSRAYHALFMRNMLVAPTPREMDAFEAEAFPRPFVIYNAGCFPCNRYTAGMTSSTSVSLHFGRGEMVILGTQYAGEMKKGVFTAMMYMMPLRPMPKLPPADRALPLHSSCNVGPNGDVSLFFGLSGTGKTTLSADPARALIGDDEHVWTDKGVFNIEGGCYAKCIDLSEEKEPDIWRAIRFGSVLENVVYDDWSRKVDFHDVRITENTRCAYPLQYIDNAKIPAMVDEHPSNIILLTCDAFGVLPPLMKLTPEQVMYHFISGYTAKVAGTEEGVVEPQATFSACFGGPFLAMHPYRYAEMLAAKMERHKASAWFINTGWVGGGYGQGSRCKLSYTRALVDAIHDGSLAALPDDKWTTSDIFNVAIPNVEVNGVPLEVLHPARAWEAAGRARDEYRSRLEHLAKLFQTNFEEYADRCSEAVLRAGPQA